MKLINRALHARFVTMRVRAVRGDLEQSRPVGHTRPGARLRYRGNTGRSTRDSCSLLRPAAASIISPHWAEQMTSKRATGIGDARKQAVHRISK